MEYFFKARRDIPHQAFAGKAIYLCHKDKCDRFKVINNDVVVESIVELTCDHEEAETRMAVHTIHASGEYNSILIASPDTDVFVIMVQVSTSYSTSIYFLTGTGVKSRIIPVTNVGQKVQGYAKHLLNFMHS